MYRCPACVSILHDATVRRCPVCGENLKRHPPRVLGSTGKVSQHLTLLDIHALSDASKVFGRDDGNAADIDLNQEHQRDSSGRTAAAEHG
jgi:hypothetical protein